jgi:hypothetical protein
LSKRVFLRSLITAAMVFSLGGASASAASLTVDDDRQDCPAANFTSVQAAIDAASTGDTVVVCPGTYVEGSGAPGTNAVTIDKEVDIKGAGADLVTIMPRRSTSSGGQIASITPVLRDSVGNIVAVTAGTPLFPAEVDISGITVAGNGVFAEAGIMFLDAKGSIKRSRVTDIVTSERPEAFDVPGGFRASDTGYGIVQATQAASPPAGGSTVRPLVIESTRVDRYNRTGILIDGATGDIPPLTSAGVSNRASIISSQIVGRLRCIDFAATGNCATVGTLTTGPLFGQDGLRVTAGASVAVNGSSFFQNYVNGVGAPVFSPNSGSPVSTNNANLSLAAGVRLIGAGPSLITGSNINNNHFGVFNVGLDGSTANTAVPLSAEGNWWGIRTTGATMNNGPQVSPTTNPAQQENPVNGTPVADATCVSRSIAFPPAADGVVSNSDAVDFCPYRNAAQADPNAGQITIPDAPIPVSDAPPTIALDFDAADFQRGDEATLTAGAADDFGVRSVTFFRGAEQIGSVSTPPYEISVSVPSDAPCETTSYSAVVEDSAFQSSSDTADLVVVDPLYNCEAAPTVTVDAPERIGAAGAAPMISAEAESGIASVETLLGGRSVCVETTAPYGCLILPTGADVGGQAVTVVVTDTRGRTATAADTTTVNRFAARITVGVARRSRTTRRISGRIVLPARVTPAQACSSGVVTVRTAGGGLPTLNRQVLVRANCSYTTVIAVPLNRTKRNRFRVSVNFGGNPVLQTARNNRRFS